MKQKGDFDDPSHKLKQNSVMVVFSNGYLTILQGEGGSTFISDHAFAPKIK